MLIRSDLPKRKWLKMLHVLKEINEQIYAKY